MNSFDSKFNGVNTESLNSAFNSMKNQPEMAKATFFVKSEWNGGFSVRSSSKDFRVGNQSVHRNVEYKMEYDFPEQLSGEEQGPTVCENCMGALAAAVYSYRPQYSSPSVHPGNGDLRDIYHPLFQKYKVDLILQGHNHNYQRSYPINYNEVTPSEPTIADSNIKNYQDPGGQLYVTVGTGGAPSTKDLDF